MRNQKKHEIAGVPDFAKSCDNDAQMRDGRKVYTVQDAHELFESKDRSTAAMNKLNVRRVDRKRTFIR